MSHRTARPQMVSAISALVVRVNGSRAIKDVDLAILFGINLSELYRRIGDKLWRFGPTSCCVLTNQYDRGQQNAERRLVFFRGGVITLAGMIRDEASFQIGLAIAEALKNRRRASAQKQRLSKRAYDPVLSERYYQARARLCNLLGSYLRSRHA